MLASGQHPRGNLVSLWLGGFSFQVLWFVYGIVWAAELWASRAGCCEDPSSRLLCPDRSWFSPPPGNPPQQNRAAKTGAAVLSFKTPQGQTWGDLALLGVLLSGVSPRALPLAPAGVPSVYPVEMLEQSWWGACACPIPWHSFPLSSSPEGAWPGDC